MMGKTPYVKKLNDRAGRRYLKKKRVGLSLQGICWKAMKAPETRAQPRTPRNRRFHRRVWTQSRQSKYSREYDVPKPIPIMKKRTLV